MVADHRITRGTSFAPPVRGAEKSRVVFRWSTTTGYYLAALRAIGNKQNRLPESFRADSIEKDVHHYIGHRFELIIAMRDDPVRRHFIQRAKEDL